jgi:hypothetical protein
MTSFGTIFIDPRLLHLPPSRDQGADPTKLQRQISQFGISTKGMPVLLGLRAIDGAVVLYDGVTRATRVAKLLPGQKVEVEIIDNLATPAGWLPTVGEKLP